MAVIINSDDVNDQPDVNDFRVEWFSGTGNGGQNRNKVQNSARIVHVPTGLKREAQCRDRKASYRSAMNSLLEDLHRLNQDKRSKAENSIRSSQVGSGMRGDKRRTYRFQDGIVTDHITNKSARTRDVMRGRFDLLWN